MKHYQAGYGYEGGHTVETNIIERTAIKCSVVYRSPMVTDRTRGTRSMVTRK